jgi:hypothetical protein
MNNKEKTERIISNVDKMRENSQDMRMWKNIPLAKECIQLLKELDSTEETPMGKALACGAVVAQLPEYDVPRLVLSILRYKLELIQASDEQDFADFELFIRPTTDFKGQLLSRGVSLKILEPQWLADEIRRWHEDSAKIYQEK